MKKPSIYISGDSPSVFETRDVLRLTGIPLLVLNKFVERNSFGVAPSVRTGRGRGSRRLFGSPDVFGIALVWWLYRSGLRSRVIGDVLKDLHPEPRSLSAQTSLAPQIVGLLISEQIKRGQHLFIVVTRSLREQEKDRKSRQKAAFVPKEKVQSVSGSSSVLVIPAGVLTEQLIAAIKNFRPEWNP